MPNLNPTDPQPTKTTAKKTTTRKTTTAKTSAKTPTVASVIAQVAQSSLATLEHAAGAQRDRGRPRQPGLPCVLELTVGQPPCGGGILGRQREGERRPPA